MSPAIDVPMNSERDDLALIVRRAVVLGVFTAVIVVLMSFITRLTGGLVEALLGGTVLAVGVYVVTFLPGQWTNASTIDGISAAAGIGLAATVVFLLIDVALLQPVGLYTNRWLAIGGGSNWWYHPVWWMVGTFLPWMGAYSLANLRARGGASVARALVILSLGTVVFGALAVVVRVPHAGWTLGTFGVAVLPALAAMTVITGLGARRG